VAMQCVCAWCGRIMREATNGEEAVTHGICAQCERVMMLELDEAEAAAASADGRAIGQTP